MTGRLPRLWLPPPATTTSGRTEPAKTPLEPEWGISKYSVGHIFKNTLGVYVGQFWGSHHRPLPPVVGRSPPKHHQRKFSVRHIFKNIMGTCGTIFGQITIEGYLETDSFVQNNQSYTLIECCFHAAIEKLRYFAT